MHLKPVIIIHVFLLEQQFQSTLCHDTCPEIPQDVCPYGVSEQTGELVKLVPKYLPRNHPEYDIRTPEESRDKTNLYCAHPACYSQPCLNGGTCTEELSGFSCSCQEGYVGMRCENDLCPVGWIYGNTKCFMIADDNMTSTWQDTRDYCDALSAVTLGNDDTVEPSLLFIESEEEFDFLDPHVVSNRAWMNCRDIVVHGTWVCVNDRAGTISTYRNWGDQQPANANNHCMTLNTKNGKMHDTMCTTLTAKICQVKIPS